jgi:hypothetical protein
MGQSHLFVFAVICFRDSCLEVLVAFASFHVSADCINCSDRGSEVCVGRIGDPGANGLVAAVGFGSSALHTCLQTPRLSKEDRWFLTSSCTSASHSYSDTVS